MKFQKFSLILLLVVIYFILNFNVVITEELQAATTPTCTLPQDVNEKLDEIKPLLEDNKWPTSDLWQTLIDSLKNFLVSEVQGGFKYFITNTMHKQEYTKKYYVEEGNGTLEENKNVVDAVTGALGRIEGAIDSFKKVEPNRITLQNIKDTRNTILENVTTIETNLGIEEPDAVSDDLRSVPIASIKSKLEEALKKIRELKSFIENCTAPTDFCNPLKEGTKIINDIYNQFSTLTGTLSNELNKIKDVFNNQNFTPTDDEVVAIINKLASIDKILWNGDGNSIIEKVNSLLSNLLSLKQDVNQNKKRPEEAAKGAVEQFNKTFSDEGGSVKDYVEKLIKQMNKTIEDVKAVVEGKNGVSYAGATLNYLDYPAIVPQTAITGECKADDLKCTNMQLIYNFGYKFVVEAHNRLGKTQNLAEKIGLLFLIKATLNGNNNTGDKGLIEGNFEKLPYNECKKNGGLTEFMVKLATICGPSLGTIELSDLKGYIDGTRLKIGETSLQGSLKENDAYSQILKRAGAVMRIFCIPSGDRCEKIKEDEKINEAYVDRVWTLFKEHCIPSELTEIDKLNPQFFSCTSSSCAAGEILCGDELCISKNEFTEEASNGYEKLPGPGSDYRNYYKMCISAQDNNWICVKITDATKCKTAPEIKPINCGCGELSPPACAYIEKGSNPCSGSDKAELCKVKGVTTKEVDQFKNELKFEYNGEGSSSYPFEKYDTNTKVCSEIVKHTGDWNLQQPSGYQGELFKKDTPVEEVIKKLLTIAVYEMETLSNDYGQAFNLDRPGPGNKGSEGISEGIKLCDNGKITNVAEHLRHVWKACYRLCAAKDNRLDCSGVEAGEKGKKGKSGFANILACLGITLEDGAECDQQQLQMFMLGLALLALVINFTM